MKDLMAQIERILPEGGQWCSLEKAQTLAALVVGTRPQQIVEIGVWMGGSLLPMLLALKYNRSGQALAIDPWCKDDSVQNQTSENAKWWGSVDHNAAFSVFAERLKRHAVDTYCMVDRRSSECADLPLSIDILHIDGNHADQAFRDVTRYAPSVRTGGYLVLDDVGWAGGHVDRGISAAKDLGFSQLYPLGTGLVMIRRCRNGGD